MVKSAIEIPYCMVANLVAIIFSFEDFAFVLSRQREMSGVKQQQGFPLKFFLFMFL